MEFKEIESDVIEILQEQEGKYQLAYQIFSKIEQKNPELAKAILEDYQSESGRPSMGENSGIAYSAATFIAKALDYFKNDNQHIQKAFLLSENLKFKDIDSGNPEGLSIWAWHN